MMRHVFTYGSLMFPEVWTRLIPRPTASVSARLPGYVREGVRGASYPGIRAQTDAQTPGRLYLNVDHEALSRLDLFEGHDYRRETVQVRVDTPDGRHLNLPAEVYCFVDSAALDGLPWDPARFARDFAASFYQAHAAPR